MVRPGVHPAGGRHRGARAGERRHTSLCIRDTQKSAQRHGASESQLAHSRRQEFGEAARLRAEIGRLKSDNAKLKAMLQEEPDTAKLRKKIVDQQAEMASMRKAMKEIAKERDRYQRRVQSKYREARKLCTRANHNLLLNALHYDHRKGLTPTDLAAAERLVIELRPMFIEEQ